MARPPTQGCICINGEFFAPDQARLSVFDHGFLYGDGLFETLRTYSGKPFLLPEHLQRLSDSAQRLSFPPLPEAEVLGRWVGESLTRSGLDEAYLRITVTRGIGARGLDPSGCDTATVLVAALPVRTYPETHYQSGIRAILLGRGSAQSSSPSPVKSTSFQHTILARQEIARRSAEEGFYLDAQDRVTEGSVSNVFCVSGGVLRTPPVEVCLAGITRAEVLRLARAEGLRTREAPLTREELLAAEEVFVTSSLAELLPVSWLEGAPVKDGRPGPIHRALLTAYRIRAGAGEK